jgi:hypothetical protein
MPRKAQAALPEPQGKDDDKFYGKTVPIMINYGVNIG